MSFQLTWGSVNGMSPTESIHPYSKSSPSSLLGTSLCASILISLAQIRAGKDWIRYSKSRVFTVAGHFSLYMLLTRTNLAQSLLDIACITTWHFKNLAQCILRVECLLHLAQELWADDFGDISEIMFYYFLTGVDILHISFGFSYLTAPYLESDSVHGFYFEG